MRILISKQPEQIIKQTGREVYDQHLGCLMVPPKHGTITKIQMTWGMDNGRFVCLDFINRTWHPEKWNKSAFIGMLYNKRHIPGCQFVCAPDVLLNAQETTNEFWDWRDFIANLGYPVAYALQDGLTLDLVPWGACDALFVGGSNNLKFSSVCRNAVRLAKQFGMYVHWGRASTPNFINYAKVIGCDSIDSSAFARYTRNRLFRAIKNLEVDQLPLFSDWSVTP